MTGEIDKYSIAIDIGNSRTCAALFEKDRIIERWHFARDEQDKTINSLLARKADGAATLKSIAISSVVPQLTKSLIDSLRSHGLTPREISVSQQTLIKNAYDGLGSDRLANAAAAAKFHLAGSSTAKKSGRAAVIDFGTATTLTLVDSEYNFGGGFITLGLKSALRSLHVDFGQLPSLEDALSDFYNKSLQDSPIGKPGKNTKEAIFFGSLLSQMGTIEKWLLSVEKLEESPLLVIATGGLSPLLAPYIDKIDILDEDLTLKGINLLGAQAKDPEDRD